jgi:hypothetical protein
MVKIRIFIILIFRFPIIKISQYCIFKFIIDSFTVFSANQNKLDYWKKKFLSILISKTIRCIYSNHYRGIKIQIKSNDDKILILLFSSYLFINHIEKLTRLQIRNAVAQFFEILMINWKKS